MNVLPMESDSGGKPRQPDHGHPRRATSALGRAALDIAETLVCRCSNPRPVMHPEYGGAGSPARPDLSNRLPEPKGHLKVDPFVGSAVGGNHAVARALPPVVRLRPDGGRAPELQPPRHRCVLNSGAKTLRLSAVVRGSYGMF